MSIFKDVTLSYKGEEYQVKAGEIMGLIARVESVISITDLASPKGPPMSPLAMGYGEALRYAGANVSNEEIYQSLFESGAINSVENAVTGLLALMIPPDAKPDKKTKASKKKSS